MPSWEVNRLSSVALGRDCQYRSARSQASAAFYSCWQVTKKASICFQSVCVCLFCPSCVKASQDRTIHSTGPQESSRPFTRRFLRSMVGMCSDCRAWIKYPRTVQSTIITLTNPTPVVFSVWLCRYYQSSFRSRPKCNKKICDKAFVILENFSIFWPSIDIGHLCGSLESSFF